MDAVRHQASGATEPYLLMCFAPPRHGKSEYWSKYVPAWYLGRFPSHQVMICSHTATLAARFSGAARDLLLEHGPADFGVKINPMSAARALWTVAGHGGEMFTSGIGGGPSGWGAHLLVIDDPIKNAEVATSPTYRDKHWQWWLSTAMNRIYKNSIVVVMQTRWHEDDLSGRMLKQSEETGQKWRVLSYPAIAEQDDPLGRAEGEPLWPAQFPLSRLHSIQQNATPYWWGAQYQQHPGSYGELCWPEEYFEDIWAEEHEWPEKFQASAIAIDPSKGKNAKKGDFCAMIFVGIANHRIWVEARLSRIPVPTIIEEGLDWYAEKRPDLFCVESNAFQELLQHEFLRQARIRGLLDFRPQGMENMISKGLRIERLQPWLAQHIVRIRKTAGGRELYRELREFPQCDHDDGPDGMEMAMRVLGAVGQAETVIGRAG